MPERITGSRYLGQALAGYGVSHVFFVPLIIPAALVEMEDLGITRVMTHGEKSAVYMADGYARAAGRPGVCFAQTVGAANMAAGLKDAYLAGSPVIAITGGRMPDYQHQHVYQELDDNAMFGPVTKQNGRVDTLQAFPGALRQAFRAATTGAPGPVHLDVSGHFAGVIDEEGELDTTVEPRFGCVPPFRPRPEPEAVAQAARALEQAQRPIIVAGGGVTLSGAGPELLRLAEKLSVPVATSLNGKGSIPENHRLAVGVVGNYSRSCANKAIAEADLVFFAGSHTGSQVTNSFRLPRPGTRVIQLDIDGAEMGRAYPNEVSLIGDAKVTLDALVAEANAVPDRGPWLHRVGELVHTWYEEFEPLLRSSAVPMRPERVCREVERALPDQSLLVSDTGHSGIWSGTMIELTKPGQRYIRAAGSLGWGFPAALGAKCALADTPVVCFTGDGGFYYHLSELETAVRYGLNVVIVVNDNVSLNQELSTFDCLYHGHQSEAGLKLWTFAPVNLAAVANDFGALGLRVERPADLPDALSTALRANRPVLIDALTDQEALGPLAWDY